MIKRTLYFGNPAYLSMHNRQLVIKLPEVEKNDALSEGFKKETIATVPIEDIGVLVLDEPQVTITHALLSTLLDNNVAVLTCDKTHLPNGYLMPLSGNTVQTEKFKAQIEATLPLKKNMWQQTIQAKIINQSVVLQRKNIDIKNMLYWADSVKSGDPENYEARAAAYYWKNIFEAFSEVTMPWENDIAEFKRERYGEPPNNLLNYGYAILRAIVARSLVSSGLLPTLGIHHHNRYNAYCLADDIMEPYRPFVDEIVYSILKNNKNVQDLTTDLKKQLLGIATVDVLINDERSPLMIATQRTTASVAKCYEGELRKISYPAFC